MKLQRKTILVFVSILIVFLLVVSAFFSTLLLSSYQTLESQYVEKDLNQAVNKLNDELLSMSSIASDWGPWDDTVEFVKGNDPNYLKSNLQHFGFENLKLNIITITNTRGHIIFSGCYDMKTKQMEQVPDFFSHPIDLSNPLMNMSEPHQVVKGIVMLPDPLLVVSQPIVYSNYTGPPQGVIIMGRYLNNDEIAKLALLTRPGLTITPVHELPADSNLVTQIKENQGEKAGIILPMSFQKIAGFALMKDIFGNDALILQITEDRDIYHQGIYTTLQVILIILAGGLILGFVVILLLDQVVLKRLGSLAHQVHEIGKSGHSIDRVDLKGDDELSDLSLEINRMLNTIEETQNKVSESESQYRYLIEDLPDYIIVYGKDHEILYLNPSAKEALGGHSEDFIGSSVLSYVSEEFRDTFSEIISSKPFADEIPAYEVEILSKNGNRRTVIVKATKVQYTNNPATFLLLTDITRRKELEMERENQATELEQYSSALHQANTKLRLLTGLTRHDIQNKLTAMQSFHLLAIDESDPDIIREYIQSAHQAGVRMEAIIGFTREYENFGSVSSGWQNLFPIIESAKNEISTGVVIIENLVSEDLEVYADPIIRKVFTTLLENAIRHGGEISKIQFTYQLKDDGLIILCEDDGEGIQTDEKEYIFDQGYGKHTGVGLFLAREILSITDLSIREVGIFGNGARFEIFIPSGKYRIPNSHPSEK